MNQPIVIIGIGELAGVFARGFLRNGYPVFPITRDMDISQAFQTVPEPALVLVAVAEKDFSDVLAKIPPQWHKCIGLLQNELLPGDWQACNITNPTVISVWFIRENKSPVIQLASTFGATVDGRLWTADSKYSATAFSLVSTPASYFVRLYCSMKR